MQACVAIEELHQNIFLNCFSLPYFLRQTLKNSMTGYRAGPHWTQENGWKSSLKVFKASCFIHEVCAPSPFCAIRDSFLFNKVSDMYKNEESFSPAKLVINNIYCPQPQRFFHNLRYLSPKWYLFSGEGDIEVQYTFKSNNVSPGPQNGCEEMII